MRTHHRLRSIRLGFGAGVRVLLELLPRGHAEAGAPLGSARLHRAYLWASLPAVAVGVASLGRHLSRALEGVPPAQALAWPLQWFVAPDSGWLAHCMLGLWVFLPGLVVAMAMSWLASTVFARSRGRPLDPSWPMSAWLFAALLPPGTPLGFVALGMAFGAVFGSLVFGGAGRYIVSPALLGLVFLSVSYPGLFAPERQVLGVGLSANWPWAAGVDASAPLSGLDWIWMLAGPQSGAVGSSSALACLAGGFYLLAVRLASWRTLAGAAVGLVAMATLVGLIGTPTGQAALPWYAHLALGNAAFGLAFLLTDPTTGGLTRGGRWAHGFLAAALIVLIRSLDPAQPEATFGALLLAGLVTPLADTLAVWRYRRQRQRRLNA